MPSDDDMAPFEAELEGVEDPGLFNFRSDQKHNGHEVFNALNPILPLIIEDIVPAMNDGRPGICQYLSRSGISITASIIGTRTMMIAVDLPAEHVPFITATTNWEGPDE